MPNALARLGVELPVVQAGMGGGLAGPALAANVSEAGGLGTIGTLGPGRDAGGHVRGTVVALELLERFRAELGDFPVLSAGGVASAEDVRTRLDAGADAVVAGTRFLMSRESGAHPDYKRRLVEADETLLTELFGVGWPAPHRVIPNAATERWCCGDP